MSDDDHVHRGGSEGCGSNSGGGDYYQNRENIYKSKNTELKKIE